jgi:hypothetical protein
MPCSPSARILGWETLTARWHAESLFQRPRSGTRMVPPAPGRHRLPSSACLPRPERRDVVGAGGLTG